MTPKDAQQRLNILRCCDKRGFEATIDALCSTQRIDRLGRLRRMRTPKPRKTRRQDCRAAEPSRRYHQARAQQHAPLEVLDAYTFLTEIRIFVYYFCRHYAWQVTNSEYIEKGFIMGAILDLVEKMRTPGGIVVTIIIVVAAYFFYKWVTAEPEEKK